MTDQIPTVVSFRLSSFTQYSTHQLIDEFITDMIKSDPGKTDVCLDLEYVGSFELNLPNFHPPFKIKRLPLNDIFFISGNKHLIMLSFEPDNMDEIDKQNNNKSSIELTQSQINNPFVKASIAIEKASTGLSQDQIATGNIYFPFMKKFEILHEKLVEDFVHAGDSVFTVGYQSSSVNEIKLIDPKIGGDLKDFYSEVKC